VVICLGRDADAYGPADATASHCLLLQVCFTFLVLAHPGSPGKRAI